MSSLDSTHREELKSALRIVCIHRRKGMWNPEFGVVPNQWYVLIEYVARVIEYVLVRTRTYSYSVRSIPYLPGIGATRTRTHPMSSYFEYLLRTHPLICGVQLVRLTMQFACLSRFSIFLEISREKIKLLLLITSRVFRFVQACFECFFSCTVRGLERIFWEIQDFFSWKSCTFSPITYLSTYSVRTRTREVDLKYRTQVSYSVSWHGVD